MFSKFAVAATIASVNASNSDHWAVIVAGSSQFYNYRHQADTCHAYQTLKKNGIPEDQIIHMAYDDIANNDQNPFPGTLFNKPTKDGVEGDNVYGDCKIDYTGGDVTATNLLNVLRGWGGAAGGPALKSDENSKIFFYFADHGAPGLVAMPTGGYLYADKLHETFKFMNENKMYKEMVVYIEACESGSMFQSPQLESDMNIYAVTAANGQESSWAAYCSPDDKVNGKAIGTCLGDLFSVNWLEDTDRAKMGTETLESQFKTVEKLTSKSHVMQFGQLSLDTEALANFQSGTDAAKEQDWWKVLKAKGYKAFDDWTEEQHQSKNTFAVDSRDVKLHYLYNRVMQESSTENHQALQDELDHRMKIDSTMEQLFGHHFEAMKNGSTPNPTDFECYRKLITGYEAQCGKLDDYSLKYLKTFAAECEAIKAYPAALDSTMHRLQKACPSTD